MKIFIDLLSILVIFAGTIGGGLFGIAAEKTNNKAKKILYIFGFVGIIVVTIIFFVALVAMSNNMGYEYSCVFKPTR